MNRKAMVTVIALLLAAGVPLLAQRDSESARQERQNNYLTNWLNEDAAFIITPEEREAFEALSTDEERYQFIEQFWLRRDFTPDTVRNEFQEEHYRRIAYANERFASGMPGWKTDRGRIYIIWGEPDQIESMPTGGSYDRTIEEGGGRTNVFPFERWRYRYIETIGNEVILEFVDPSFSNEYRLALSPHEKDALAHVPGVGFTDFEMYSGDPETARVNRGLGTGRINQFDLLETYSKIWVPADVEFKDLEAIVTTNLSYNLLPFEMKADFVKVTNESVLTPITVQIRNSDVAFRENRGIHVAQLNVFGRVTAITGRVADTFEDTVSIELLDRQFEAALDSYHVYQKILNLAPGNYKIDLVIKDIYSEDVGTLSRALPVPRFPEGQLSASSLLLAHRIQPLSSRQVGTGQFVLGGLKVTRSVGHEFYRDSDLNYWLQVYSLGVDAASKPAANVETIITRDGREVGRIAETSSEFSGAAQQMTLYKTLPLADYEPGTYTLQVRVTDTLTGEVASQTADFVVVDRPAAE